LRFRRTSESAIGISLGPTWLKNGAFKWPNSYRETTDLLIWGQFSSYQVNNFGGNKTAHLTVVCQRSDLFDQGTGDMGVARVGHKKDRFDRFIQLPVCDRHREFTCDIGQWPNTSNHRDSILLFDKIDGKSFENLDFDVAKVRDAGGDQVPALLRRKQRLFLRIVSNPYNKMVDQTTGSSDHISVTQGDAYAADEIFLDPFRLVVSGGDHTQADDAGALDRTQIKSDDNTSLFEDSPHTEIVGESYRVAYLVDISDMSQDQRYSLVNSEYTLGRQSTSDIVLADSSISKAHALLKVQAGQWHIEDLDSSNGVLLNGTLIKRAPLNQGDRIKLGRAELIFGFETRSRA